MINQIINDFAKGSSLVMRKSYITFCTQAIAIFSFRRFKEQFLEPLLLLADDVTPQVKIHFLNCAI
jgi:hypothetical protein